MGESDEGVMGGKRCKKEDAGARQVMESQVKAGRQAINHPSNFVNQTAKLGGQYSCSVTLSNTRIYDVLFQKLEGAAVRHPPALGIAPSSRSLTRPNPWPMWCGRAGVRKGRTQQPVNPWHTG